jgi:hypothetical protein
MPMYIIRDIPADVWRAAKAKAASEGTSLKALFLRWLAEYAGKGKRQ